MKRNLRPIIRKLDYKQTEEQLDKAVSFAVDAIEMETYDFSKYTKQLITKGGKKRHVYSFDTLSVENILCHYLKNEIDKAFHVKYASRSRIINLFFNTLPAVKDMNDFVIVRADFKDFFNSILTEHVYNEYIQNSPIRRADKEILKKYIEEFKFCYAGLCLSNEMAEIVCRDFDRLIRAKLEKYGIIFYERYVDDMLILLKSFINRDDFLEIIDATIKEVFKKCPVQLNMDADKFSFVSCRDLQRMSLGSRSVTEKIDFLGYEFIITYNPQIKNIISFKYGISKKKRDRYKHIIEQAFVDYVKDGNSELLRQRIKLFSARVVIPRSLGNKRIEWLTNGITSNYGELRHHLGALDKDTEAYLKELFMQLVAEYDIQTPHYLKEATRQDSIYNLYSNLKRNRSIIFDKTIGVQRKDLLRWIRRIRPDYSGDNKRYYQLVMEYFELLNKNNTIS